MRPAMAGVLDLLEVEGSVACLTPLHALLAERQRGCHSGKHWMASELMPVAVCHPELGGPEPAAQSGQPSSGQERSSRESSRCFVSVPPACCHWHLRRRIVKSASDLVAEANLHQVERERGSIRCCLRVASLGVP